MQERIDAPGLLADLLRIHREALAALAFLTRAIKAETASLETVKAVAHYLRQAANRPELRFQAPESFRG